MERHAETHPLPPLYTKDSRVLILGSFPSPRSRAEAFFYAHPQNRFWRVLAALFGETVPRTMEEKTALLFRNHIALWDTVGSCEIAGASDASITNVIANDLHPILETADIRAIFCNGSASYRWYNMLLRDELGRDAVLLPSTSPANAAWTLEKLIDAWGGQILPHLE